MKLKELLAGLTVLSATADMDAEISGVSYDSRATVPGDLFVAMTGYATDGHRFIPMAKEKGAAAVLGAGEGSNLVMGAFNAMKSFGSIFGSALAGFLYEWMPKMPFVFGCGAFALAALMALLMARSEN